MSTCWKVLRKMYLKAHCTLHSINYILHLHHHSYWTLYTSNYILTTEHCTPYIYTTCCTFFTSHYIANSRSDTQDLNVKMNLNTIHSSDFAHLDCGWQQQLKTTVKPRRAGCQRAMGGSDSWDSDFLYDLFTKHLGWLCTQYITICKTEIFLVWGGTTKVLPAI